jgi:hypothetical protein
VTENDQRILLICGGSCIDVDAADLLRHSNIGISPLLAPQPLNVQSEKCYCCLPDSAESGNCHASLASDRL